MIKLIRSFTSIRISLTAGLIAAALLLGPVIDARAATSTPPVTSADVVVIAVHLDGQFTATTANAAAIKLPFAGTLLGVSATARASGGTSPTLTVMVEDDNVDVLSSAISITAGTVSEGTISTSTIADESVLTVDLVIGGTSPTWDDIDVVLTFARR